MMHFPHAAPSIVLLALFLGTPVSQGVAAPNPPKISPNPFGFAWRHAFLVEVGGFLGIGGHYEFQINTAAFYASAG
jgi:hypothetical protein